MKNHSAHQFQWSSKLESGNEQIDKEHKEIMNILSELEIFISKSPQPVSKAIAKLTGKVAIYVIDHFLHEEEFMTRLNYPDFKAHKELHKEMTCALAERLKDADNMSADDLDSLYQFLYEWIETHLFVEDYKFIKWKRNEPH